MAAVETTQQPRRARILLVDDHPIVRHGLTALLKAEPDFEVCGEAGSFEEAEQMIATCRPDLVVLDITLKERNGLHLIPVARKIHPDIKILVLSMHDERDYAADALRAGAQGYIMKEKADAALVEGLRAVLRGETFVSEEIAARVSLENAAGSDRADRPARGVEALTPREMEIFEMIGRGMTTRAIAETLKLSRRTVEVHRAHIKEKMECETAAELVRCAVRWLETRGASPPA
jgi:DNA-binding NarL/FixJ family response regulator